MSKTNKQTKADMLRNETYYATADRTNKEGHAAFSRGMKESFVQLLLTNTVENTFYTTQRELAKETIAIQKKMLIADIKFFTKAIVFARQNGNMRLQPIIGLVTLSTAADKSYFRKAFDKVIRTPSDLQSFVELCKDGGIRNGLGRVIKKAIEVWMGNMSEYHAIKYGGKAKQYSLRNILRLVRPVPNGINNSNLYNYIVNGWTPDKVKGIPQVSTYERLKKATTESEIIACIDEGKLPYEAVTGVISPTTKVWTHLMKQMPIMAITRHLNTLQKHGVFDDNANIDYVVGKFSDEQIIKNSRMLPFRWHSAYLAYSGEHMAIKDALISALNISLGNFPALPGKIAIAVDVSGSMSWHISGNSKAVYSDIASLFACGILKQCNNPVVLPFELRVHDDLPLSKHDSVMTNANKIKNICGGGTDCGCPIQYLSKNNIVVDTIIAITDNEEWGANRSQYGYSGISAGFWAEFNEYKRNVNKDVKAYVITISPQGDSMIPADTPDITQIYGWSDTVVPFIASHMSGKGSQIDAINKVEL